MRITTKEVTKEAANKAAKERSCRREFVAVPPPHILYVLDVLLESTYFCHQPGLGLI